MITLNLDWHEVLWWMKGGMAGSHLCWNVYEDMVDKVWPQCSEQERRNLWFIMRRDLGSYWRPDGWSGFDLASAHGEGEWKPAAGVLTYDDDKRYDPSKVITDLTPWMYFRQVLARFDPENQYAVTMHVHNAEELDSVLLLTPSATIISLPKIPRTVAKAASKREQSSLLELPSGSGLGEAKYDAWQSDTATVTVRAYKWQNEYHIDWRRQCDESRITKVEQMTIEH